MGTMAVLTRDGDITVAWDPVDEASAENARKEFARLKEEGYNFYAVDEVKGKKLDEFDPALGRIIAAPGARSSGDKKQGRREGAMAGGPNDLTVALG